MRSHNLSWLKFTIRPGDGYLATSDYPARLINLDDEATANAARADPTGLVAGISGPAVIDEISM